MDSHTRSVYLLLFAATIIGFSYVPIINTLENNLARTPPMGWLAWERFTCQIDCTAYPESCINANLFISMSSQLKHMKLDEFGYKYINIDDCWDEKTRNSETLALIPDKSRFPNGIKAVADHVHSLGLKLGLYGDCGDFTCGGYPGQLVPNSNADYFELDAKTFTEWEIDSFKFDGCYIDPPTAEQRCPKFSHALQATNRSVLLVCEWPFYMMYSGDSVNWQLVVDSCNVWRYYDDIEDSWQSILNTIDYTIEKQDTFVKYHGPGHWFDPDQLVIGNFGLTPNQEEAQMAIWSIWAAPLYMSNDLRNISESSLAILTNKNLIAVNQDELGVHGLMSLEYKNKGFDHITPDPFYQAFVKPVLPIVGDCPSFAIVYLSRNRLGGEELVSFSLLDLLQNSRAAIKQAEIHASKSPNQEAKFDANKCLDSLKNSATLIKYNVFDLLADSQQAIELPSVLLSESLTLGVKPSGVRAVKLIAQHE